MATYKKEIWRTVKYTLVAASAGIIEVGSLVLLDTLTNFPHWICYLIALILSVLWNFTINRRYTFKSANNVPKAMLLVAAYYIVFTPLSTWSVRHLTLTLHWHKALADALNILINFVTEFLYQRFVVFGKSIDTNDLAK